MTLNESAACPEIVENKAGERDPEDRDGNFPVMIPSLFLRCNPLPPFSVPSRFDRAGDQQSAELVAERADPIAKVGGGAEPASVFVFLEPRARKQRFDLRVRERAEQRGHMAAARF